MKLVAPFRLEDRWLASLLIFLVAYSLLILLLAWGLGLGYGGEVTQVAGAVCPTQPAKSCPCPKEKPGCPPVRYAGYFDKPNWLLFFLWWPLIAIPLYGTWHPFFWAWSRMRASRVLHGPSGGRVLDAVHAQFEASLRKLRFLGFMLALALSLPLNVLDASDVVTWYRLTSAELRRSRVEEVASNPRVLRGTPEYDFTIAALIHEHNKEPQPVGRRTNIMFNLAAYVQQTVLTTLAFLVLFQVSIHSLVFWFLEALPVARRNSLSITLDPRSPLHEFGLEHWNHVLNNMYWILSAAMIVPIVSRASQAGAKPDVGQLMLQLGTTLLVGLPMALTIISRQQRLPRLWNMVAENGSPELLALYHNQRLWPLDKNWVSKSGILLAFFLLAYFLGVKLKDLLP